MKKTLFTTGDVLFWGGFSVGSLALAIGAHLTPQDPPVPLVGWAILWSVVAGFWFTSIAYFIKKKRTLDMLHFVDRHGIVVGWKKPEYAVKQDDFEDQIEEMITKMLSAYPHCATALRGCLVFFVEPVWYHQTPGFVARKVAGVQDGMLIYVGWREKLSESALQHELAHRVLQVFAGDPPEAVAHDMMQKMGL
jgi:hypothetical protein